MNDNIFSIPIQFNDLKLDTDKFVSFAYDLKSKDDTGNLKSNIGGWQSNNVDLTNFTLQPLCIEILKCAEIYKELVDFKEDLQITLKNGWFNINGYKDYNNIHDHPKSVISGVFYIQTTIGSGGISFYHPSENITWAWSDGLKKVYSSVNSQRMNYPPIVNRLFLFPSWLKHSVQPNMVKELDRISFSFNLLAQ